MSSRSMGVMKVVFSRLTISWVTWSAWCSTSLIACVSRAGLGEVVHLFMQKGGGLDDTRRLLLEVVEKADLPGGSG